jgi:hypothetical protein
MFSGVSKAEFDTLLNVVFVEKKMRKNEKKNRKKYLTSDIYLTHVCPQHCGYG